MFTSLINGLPCTAPQYLAEFVISRKAKKLNKVLEDKFWFADEWKREYKLQVIAANSLLKLFEVTDILAGLRSQEGSWIYSLTNKALIDILNRQKIKNKNIAVTKQPVHIEIKENPTILSKPKTMKKNNMLDKLEELDGDVQRHDF